MTTRTRCSPAWRRGSSSPVKLVRDEHYEANIRGVYPCGEGAGYAGGILSAAADGMRCAEKIWEVYNR